IQLRALQALGDLDDPSDLALRLDQRIQHILVDEFQDTSYAQFTLLKQLCAGWTENDGRTLFVVGDPMQSIYRFRNAEIGLYLQALHTGVGSVALEPLKLTVNFRSQQGIVEWVNDTFSQVFPANTDVNSGTVGYEHSDPWHPPGCSPPVHLHPRIGRDDQGESAQILPIIREALEQDHRVAVLVRSRDHLRQISQQLKQQKISFQALDILPLSTMPVIQDLRSLTRAMLHQGDRLAWLSVLRAPWCGLD
ncbi:MAG: UvrD-helicase domain-containing protein, partial [bacterium]